MNSPQRMVDSSTQRLPGSVALRERKSDAASQTATGRLSATAMRNALEPFGRKRNAYALMLLAIDLSLFVVGQFLAITATSGWLQIVGMLVTLAAIVRLFLIGHDACHQALTSSRPLNDLAGRIAFLVSLTPYSLWRAGHNIGHHGFNNLRGRDFVWQPKQPEEYLALPRWRRAIERVYRGALGPAMYYLVEIWWKHLYFPNRRHIPSRRAEFNWDSLLVTVMALAWVGSIFVYTQHHQRAFWPVLLAAFIVPFVLWNWAVGLIVYLHHTHPDVPWYEEKRDWQQHMAQISSTIHMVMPPPLGAFLHHIMEHPAHHLNSHIPLYNLKAAQQHLRQIGARFTSTPFTLSHYLRCIRTCQLYDYRHQSWRSFRDAAHA